MRRLRELSTKRKAITATVALVVSGGILSVGLATVALAVPKTPTPSITGGPSGPTASTSASFTFTDTASPVTFQCALDGGPASSCSSPLSYSGLTQGSHTFAVNATATGKSTSSDATRTWTVDTRPPAIAVAGPVSGGAYNAAGWSGSCSAGICGTATDPAGVAQVTVAVLQQSSSRYWNGAAFSSTSAVFIAASGTTSWRYGLALPVDGSYIAYVRSTDSLSNATAPADPATVAFRIDTLAPTKPVLLTTPDNPTAQTTAQFTWSANESGLIFRCGLDGATPSACPASGTGYSSLKAGDHCFSLIATDPAGNSSGTTTYCWTILISSGFQISGNTIGPLAPGVSRPVNLVILNSFNFAIRVTSVAVTIGSSSKTGCVSGDNFTVTHSLLTPVTVPANSSRSLSAAGVDQANWPLVTMRNLASPQDACKNATFTLTFSGTAEKA